MKSELEYDSSRPLMRLEKGDKVFIKYREAIYENEKDRSMYKNVPDGYYNELTWEITLLNVVNTQN